MSSPIHQLIGGFKFEALTFHPGDDMGVVSFDLGRSWEVAWLKQNGQARLVPGFRRIQKETKVEAKGLVLSRPSKPVFGSESIWGVYRVMGIPQ